jgi:hypothetical protein
MILPTNLVNFNSSSILEIIPGIKKIDPNMRKIAMSWITDLEFIKELNNLGVDAFYPLPVDCNVLASKIRELFFSPV